MAQRVLVVGGAGYLGGAVTDLLSESPHNFRVFDALLYEESFRKPVDFVFGDVRHWDQLEKHLTWADVVIWLAALVGDAACALNPGVTKEVNEEAVQKLAESFDGRIIFTSTCSVYGAQEGELNENSPCAPLSLYAGTKLAAEGHLLNKNALILRLGTLFGVSDYFARIRFDLVVNFLTMVAGTEGALTVFGGEQFRPLIHVRDVAKVIVDNLETPLRGVFNLHRQNVRIRDVAYQIRNHFPDAEVQFTEMTFQDTRNYRVSSAKYIEATGWRPQWSIDNGIEEVKRLIETQRLKDVKNPRYTNHLCLAPHAHSILHNR